VTSHHLQPEQWDQVRFEYETSPERPTLRGLADKHRVSRSTIFKRAAREHWKQNAALVEATRQQIVKKMEASLEAKVDEAAELAANQVMADLEPWIEQEKVKHIKRAVKHGKTWLRANRKAVGSKRAGSEVRKSCCRNAG